MGFLQVVLLQDNLSKLAAKPFDYSKWDKIELSDDEDDLHPNIDKDSWFRWKHKARIEREEREKKEKEQLDLQLGLAKARRHELDNKLKAAEAGTGDGDVAALKSELAEVDREIKGYNDRLIEMEKNRKLNVDNLGTVVKDYTFINKRETTDVLPEDFKPSSSTTSTSSAPSMSAKPDSALPPAATTTAKAGGATPPPAPTPEPDSVASSSSSSSSAAGATGAKPMEPGARSDLEQVENYSNFVTAYQDLLEEFSEIKSLDETREMLHHKGHILLAEHAQSYLLLSCLEDEMNGQHERMKNTARQSQILSHICELAVSLRRSPRDVVVPFFHKLESPENINTFKTAVAEFIKRIQKRAVDKRKEMAEARARGEDDGYEDVEVPLEERLGPGGLDPVEVFKNLPTEMQEAFEERDMEKLHKALAEMPVEEAKRHMKACQDSGLWVPGGGSGDDP